MARTAPKWFLPYIALGYTIERAGRTGHLKVRDAAGNYVTSVSCTPSDINAHKSAERQLRRHAAGKC